MTAEPRWPVGGTTIGRTVLESRPDLGIAGDLAFHPTGVVPGPLPCCVTTSAPRPTAARVRDGITDET